MKELVKTCCFCNKQKHLYINEGKGVFHCFKCGKSGSNDLLKAFGYNKQEVIIEKTTQLFDLYSNQWEELIIKQLSLPEEYIPIETGSVYHKYLNYRNITDEQIKKYKIGCCSSGEYAGSIILPVYENNDLVYWQARYVYDWGKRYENPSISKIDVIFNYDTEYDEVVICEGIFDALTIGDNAVALLGKEMSSLQKNKLLAKFKSFVICLDADAYLFAVKIARQLKNVRICKLIKGDPNSNINVKKYIEQAHYFYGVCDEKTRI